MKILLTGGAGFIGSHTAVELLACGHDIVIADNFVNSKPEAIARIEKISGKKIKLYNIDVADPDELDKLFAAEALDAVVHFAGLKAVGESVKIPVKYYRNNIDTTLNLLEIMEKYNVNNFIFSSSATVYGNPKTVPVTEDMPTGGCTNPYGETKLMIERILTDASKANPALSVVLLRYFNPIGAHSSGLLCEDPNGIPNNLMPFILKVAGGKIDKLSVFGNDYDTPDGTGVRDYIHVVDLALGHVKAVDYAAKNKGVEVFNLGTGIGYSVLDVINTFERVNEIKVPYVIADRRPGDIATVYGSPEKAGRVIGWQAKYGIEDMCRDAWMAQQKNPDGYQG